MNFALISQGVPQPGGVK